MKIKFIITSLFVFFIGSNPLYAQETCPGESLAFYTSTAEPPASWTDCIGKYTRYSEYGSNPVDYVYIGEFKKGKKHGEGNETYADNFDKKQIDKKYIGKFKENKRHGEGTYTRKCRFKQPYFSKKEYGWRECKAVGEWREGKLWNGTTIYPSYGDSWSHDEHRVYENGNLKSSEEVSTKEYDAWLAAEKKEKLARERRLQEKVKSANVDKNKCYTLFKHAHSVYQASRYWDIYLSTLKSLGVSIDKIKLLQPSIDETTRKFLIVNYSEFDDLQEDYFSKDGKYRHIKVACENLADSLESANPFE
jgi:hypothetical protein